jgi:hypothetical protein
MQRAPEARARTGPLAVLGWSDAIIVVVGVAVTLAVIGAVASAAARGDAADASASVAGMAAAYLACAELALAPVAPALAAARVMLDGSGPATRASFSWAQASVAAALPGAGAASRGYVEAIGGASDRASWAARMTSEYGRTVAPGASCANTSALVMSYCAAGSGGGGGACDPPLFECLDSAAADTAEAAIASGEPRGTMLPGGVGLYRVFTPVSSAAGGANASALLVATVDVGALLAHASTVGVFNDIAVTLTDSDATAAGGTSVCSFGVSAGTVVGVPPVLKYLPLLGANVSVLVTPSAGFVAGYQRARNTTTALMMGLVPVRGRQRAHSLAV